MTKPQTLVSIQALREADGVVTTDLFLHEGAWPTEPVAPATLWRRADMDEHVLDLHRLLSLEEADAQFESYAVGGVMFDPREPLWLYSWWMPSQLQAAQDATLKWTHRRYESPDHDHCLLTWETIQGGDEAYVSKAGWISEDAYRRFIENDELRLRSPGPPSE
jgi:hypothetical protein